MMAAYNKFNNNTKLRAGIVVKTYPIDDNENVTKLSPEYDVVVIEKSDTGAVTPQTYRRCLSAEGLGSIADFFVKTYRSQKSKKGKSIGLDYKNQDGAIVLLLCLDGESDKAVIIGALTHPDRKTRLKGDGMELKGEFNGLSISVNDDGSANLTFKGATDNEGKPLDSSQGNTTIDIEKDGTLQFKNKGNTFRLEKAGGVLLNSDGDVAVSVKKGMAVSVEEAVSIDTKKDLSLKTDNIVFEAQGSCTGRVDAFSVEAINAMKLKGMMVTLEAASLVKIKGTQVQIDGVVFLGGAGGTPAPTLQTSYIGIGNLGIPVVSNAVGPFATKVFIK
jgi:hypothetical protein